MIIREEKTPIIHKNNVKQCYSVAHNRFYYVKSDIKCTNGITIVAGSYVQVEEIKIEDYNFGSQFRDVHDKCKVIFNVLDENNKIITTTGTIPLTDKVMEKDGSYSYDYEDCFIPYLIEKSETKKATEYYNTRYQKTEDKYNAILRKKELWTYPLLIGFLFVGMLGSIASLIHSVSAIGIIFFISFLLGLIGVGAFLKIEDFVIDEIINNNRTDLIKFFNKKQNPKFTQYLHTKEREETLQKLEFEGIHFNSDIENKDTVTLTPVKITDKQTVFEVEKQEEPKVEKQEEPKKEVKDAFSDYPNMFDSIEETYNYGNIELTLNKSIDLSEFNDNDNEKKVS